MKNLTIYKTECFELKTVEITSLIIFVDDDNIGNKNLNLKFSIAPVDYFDEYIVYPVTKIKEGSHFLLLKHRKTNSEKWMMPEEIYDFFYNIFISRSNI